VVGRSMIEMLLQAALLRKDPAKHTAAFFEHGQVTRYLAAKKAVKLVDEGRTVLPTAATPFDLASPRMIQLQQQFEANKHKFKKGKTNRFWDNWWCYNISKLAELAKPDQEYGQYLFDLYQFAYANDRFTFIPRSG
jgi:hypothetical protein